MSSEDREYMLRQTGRIPQDRPVPQMTPEAIDRAAQARQRTHEQKVRTLLGCIAVFTGIVAVATVANFISGVILTLSVTKPY